ncbi:hypothetical protein FD755_024986 [Muntiacus reevesi]|uniref:RNA-directed DNA polymerase n=1 Tax=Muntiacus reevesi TaxID=9886 RepID=A0A5N3URJ7_MUNRE|nr:hypothetical protein FD755_024987 [Muntiacus reevesi]KAB0339332.1 hypothetical protein FD755_024986 [Muntiacus reevesi]
MVDTGAQHSVLNKKLGPMSKKTSLVQGATGTKRYCWTTERKVNLGTHQVSHSFLVIPECPAPLLGRDLLTKVNAQIHFDPGGMSVTDGLGQPIHVLSLALRDEYRLFVPKPSETIALDVQPWVHKYPLAWAETAGMGLAKQRHPVVIELKAEAVPMRVKQYPMSQEARRGITPHIRRLMDARILRRCQSPWNTPLLPVKKPGGTDYRPVQDLREVNKQVSDIHPTVPNPYTLLSSLLPEYTWYTVLDLKDAFFSLPLAAQSQEIFAFEWTEGEGQPVVQLTWTRLPQGFKNSPTLFNEALSEDLYKKQGIGKGVLTQQWGPWKRPVAYLSKRLDPVAAGWPPCLRIIAATALLVRDADKLTYGQQLLVYTPHAIEGVLKQPPGKWIPNARLTHYQALLLDAPRVRFQTPCFLNPATLLLTQRRTALSMTAMRYWLRPWRHEKT